jgi:hypothetical protein
MLASVAACTPANAELVDRESRVSKRDERDPSPADSQRTVVPWKTTLVTIVQHISSPVS